MMHAGADPAKHNKKFEASGKSVKWRSPSNIAIVKYWGKHGDQLPHNPSLSFTLTNAHTTTEVTYTERGNESPVVDFLFEGKHRPDFSERIERYVRVIKEHLPVLDNDHFVIRSENSFPHSTGIASSASAMNALAVSLCAIAYQESDQQEDFLKQVSCLSRLGSGSACRSAYGPVAVWGSVDDIPDSSDRYAVPLTGISPVFHRLQDTILIVDKGPKAVSSSAGHALMHGHPFAETRFTQARSNLKSLTKALKQGDLQRFFEVTENEALSLHAMMMSSSPGYVLMRPGTLQIIEKVQQARRDEKLPVCFTLDAGPNVHLLYPEDASVKVKQWIDAELRDFCTDGWIIHDVAGTGPVNMAE